MRPEHARLLLVDDDPGAIQVMARMLAHYPNQRFATSGDAAMELACEWLPDLVVVDADMPGMTGLDVCAAFRADVRLAAVPIIVATSHEEPALEVSAFEGGAVDFVRKPLVATRLSARVRAALRPRRRSRDEASAPPRPTPRLLIVDDDVAAVRILRRALHELGDFSFAVSGEESLRVARRDAPDLILLDAHMPGTDGFEVCRALKSEAAFSDVPIVFVTRFSDPRNEHRALELGAADFISKPYVPSLVRARVRNQLALRRQAQGRVQAERSRWRHISDARLGEVVRAASDAIVGFDAGGRVVLVNEAACRLLAAPLENLVGRPIESLLGPAFTDRERGASSRRIDVRRADGAVVPVEASMFAVGEGADRLTTLMLRDTAIRDGLERESHARVAAEAASRMKSAMLAYVAHEIGNPLNGILGFSQLMAEDASEPLGARQAARLARVQASGRDLQRLLGDLVDIGRCESGRLAVELEPVIAQAALEAAAAASEALAEPAGVTLVIEPPMQGLLLASADAARLQQCLLNLVSNAIKYGRRGGRVTLQAERRDDAVAFVVEDDGRGMTAEQLAHLFEPFNRLGRQAAGIPGSGLGLVVTRSLVAAMGGRLDVASAVDAGSRFTIVLEAATVGAADLPALAA